LNETHRFTLYADNVNLVGENIDTIEGQLDASKFGLLVNAKEI
jgi:hypothetical protein